MHRSVQVGLQAAEAALQGPHEALAEVVHRADELVGHCLVQPYHDQFLDLLDAGFDIPGGDWLSVGCHNDICGWEGGRERGTQHTNIQA